MIYTVTFNPSLDYFVTVDNFQMGMTNRTSKELMFPGGKGLNVSIVLKNLGIKSTALGFVAGFTGKEIMRCITKDGIDNGFVELEGGLSRINVKLQNYEGTEINGMGPDIQAKDIDVLMNQLCGLNPDDILVLAGSIPSTLPSDMYKQICERLKDKGVHIVVDATKDLLVNVLEYHPFLIKPNNHELGELFDVTLSTRESVVPYAKKLQEKGARNVLISMAGEGAVLVAEDGSVFESPAPRGTLVNGVGAGDSMVAGFITGYIEKKDYEHAFKMGISTGSASAFSEFLATREEVEKVLPQVHPTRL